MLRRTLTPLALMMLILLMPSSLLAAQDPAGQAILGKWDLKSLQVGEEVEESEPGAFAAEFLAEGKMKTYRDGKVAEEGTYKIEGDQITVTIGDDDPDTSKFKIEGDVMTVSQEIQPGLKMTMTFNRVAAE